MSSIWDCFSPLRGLIDWLDGETRTTVERGSVCLHLEALENREVPSATLLTQTPDPSPNLFVQTPITTTTIQQTLNLSPTFSQVPNLSQSFQQALQTQNALLASQAQPLQSILTSLVTTLPDISNGLNVVMADLSRFEGSQAAQHHTQMLATGIDWFLLKLETATEITFHAAGVSQEPTFNMDVAFINAFVANPLNYTPPV